MIEKTDLRIGNWVMDRDNRLVRIGAIHNAAGAYIAFFKEDYPKGGDYCGDLKPVPLTEEILIACWFEKDNYGTFHIPIKYGQFLCIKYYESNGKKGWSPAIDFGDCMKQLPDKNYLHELQNAYYALSSMELEIDLTKQK